MTFLELAIKGVRNFTEFTRIPLNSGLNTVYGGNQSGKTTLWAVLRVMLMGKKIATVQDADQWGQAALTFRGNDGHTYSLAEHFGENRHKLARREADGSFQPVDPQSMGDHPLAPPDGDTPLWPVCLGGTHWLPSLQLLGGSGNAGGDQLKSASASGSVELARADQAATASKTTQLESALAECYDRRTLLAEKLSTVERINRERGALDEKQEALAPVSSLSDQQLEELVRYLEDEATLKEQRITLDQTIIAREDDLDRMPTTTLLKRPSFHIGWSVTGIGGGLNYLFGLYPVVMGTFAFGVLMMLIAMGRSVGLSSKKNAIRKGIAQLRAELDALDAPLNERYHDLLVLLKQQGFTSPRAAYTAYDRLATVRERMRVLNEELERALEGDTLESIEAGLDELDERIHTIQETHAELQTTAAHPALNGGETQPEHGPSGGRRLDLSIEPHLNEEPAFREVLDRKQDAYTRRAGELLTHFTGGEFTELTVNGTYYPTLHGDHSGKHAAATPGSGMADLIYLAQYLAMIDTLDPAGHFPLVLDEPFLTLDAERRDLVYSALQECSRRRQVVLLTCQKFLTSPSDHIVLL